MFLDPEPSDQQGWTKWVPSIVVEVVSLKRAAPFVDITRQQRGSHTNPKRKRGSDEIK